MLPLVIAICATGALFIAFRYRRLLGFGEPPIALQNPKFPIKLTLITKDVITHDTFLFRFALPSPDQVLGLPTGQNVILDAEDKNGRISRAYTPVSTPDKVGHVDFVIKVYFPSSNFPNGGRMTQLLNSLSPGSEVKMRGPFGRLRYAGPPGHFEIKAGKETKSYHINYLGLIAGGSGITPMYQMIQVLLSNSAEPIKISLLFANKTKEDLILEGPLNELCEKYPDQFDLTYVISQMPEEKEATAAHNEKFHFGFVDQDIMRDKLPLPGEDTLIAVCGPPLMISEACMPALKQLGYDITHIHVF